MVNFYRPNLQDIDCQITLREMVFPYECDEKKIFF